MLKCAEVTRLDTEMEKKNAICRPITYVDS